MTQLDIKLTADYFSRHVAVMSLRDNGNVGIGTTEPATDALAVTRGIKLDVVGGIRIRNPNNTAQWMDFFYDSANTFCMYYQTGNGIFVGTGAGQRGQ